MQNGRKANMNRRQQRSAASFAARSKPWSSNATRPEPKGSHNAQRNYERYLELSGAGGQWRHIAGTAWSTKRYLNIELLKDQQMRGAITA
jgi:hypothetical protein